MPETLLGYLLARLSDFPQATFSEAELSRRFPVEFKAARDQKLLRYVQTNLEAVAYPCSSPFCEGGSRSIANIDGQMWALCNCSALADPTNIEKAELSTWRLDIDCLCSAFQQRNGLGGESEALSDRLVYLGKTTRGGRSFGIILGLLGQDQVRLHLTALPRLVTDSHDCVVLLCPGFRPTQKLIREFEPRRIILAGLDDEEPSLIKATVFGTTAGPEIDQDLTDEEREEVEQLNLLTSVRVHLVGLSGPKNIVRINGLNVQLTLKPFLFFLRLAVARLEADDGFVQAGRMMAGGGLVEEGYYKAESTYQSWSRVREPFSTALQGVAPLDFLQLRDGKGRISTLRGRVTWDAQILASHQNAKVQQLVKRLLEASAKEQPPLAPA